MTGEERRDGFVNALIVKTAVINTRKKKKNNVEPQALWLEEWDRLCVGLRGLPPCGDRQSEWPSYTAFWCRHLIKNFRPSQMVI